MLIMTNGGLLMEENEIKKFRPRSGVSIFDTILDPPKFLSNFFSKVSKQAIEDTTCDYGEL